MKPSTCLEYVAKPLEDCHCPIGEPAWVLTEKGIQPTPLAASGLTTMPTTPRFALYHLNAASASVGLSVMFAAASRFPLCQAVRNAVPVWVALEAPELADGEKPVVGSFGAVPGTLSTPAAASPPTPTTATAPPTSMARRPNLRPPSASAAASSSRRSSRKFCGGGSCEREASTLWNSGGL